MTTTISTLPNGLRVITHETNNVGSVALGLWADVGTRNEDLSQNGIAHMVEHMLFNGTLNRSAQQIVQEIEDVGGQMNAYTSRENTAYYIHLLKDDAARAFEILSDMMLNSTFPESEIEKERKVIIQEIGMTYDTPDDIVFDYYQEAAYPNQALGAPILGTSKIIESIEKQNLHDYVTKFYCAENLVLSVAGNISHDQSVAYAGQYLANLSSNAKAEIKAAHYQGGAHLEEKDLEQTHVVLGFQGVQRTSVDYYAAQVFSILMGGGMSSRLFQSVREKHGLAYSVYSSHSAFKDDGQFEIYVGTGPEKLSELMPVLIDEIKKSQDKASTEELERARAQLKSSIVMSTESMLSRANRQAKYLMACDEAFDIQTVLDQIDAVGIEDIQNITMKIFASKPTLSALGPLQKMADYSFIESKLAA
ncbi:MAG: pitrilysin family protein [Pseudomonadota bacterium]